MKTKLKWIWIFALLFCSAQALGQEMEGDWNTDPDDDYENDTDPNHWKELWEDYAVMDDWIGPGGHGTVSYDTVPDTVTMMTYNLWVKNCEKSNKHAKVINLCHPDVVAIQELQWLRNFNKIKNKTGLKGERCVTKGSTGYGIALLWNENRVGRPIITPKKMDTPNDGYDKKRAYIIAEFTDFCFVATHYSQNQTHRIEMTNDILNHPVIQNCRNKGKPVYVAGDLNIQPSDFENGAIKIFVDAGFEVLKNDTVPYTYPTPIKPEANPGLADIILEYNKNPNHKTIESGIPEFLQTERDLIQAAQGQGIILDLNQYLSTVSDHYPYYVKVKLK